MMLRWVVSDQPADWAAWIEAVGSAIAAVAAAGAAIFTARYVALTKKLLGGSEVQAAASARAAEAAAEQARIANAALQQAIAEASARRNAEVDRDARERLPLLSIVDQQLDLLRTLLVFSLQPGAMEQFKSNAKNREAEWAPDALSDEVEHVRRYAPEIAPFVIQAREDLRAITAAVEALWQGHGSEHVTLFEAIIKAARRAEHHLRELKEMISVGITRIPHQP